MPLHQPSLIRTVRATIKRHGLFIPGGKVIVAVSGGIDSMVLLDLLASLDEYRLDLVVAHLNHLLRGDESDRDEEFVRAEAARYGLPCVVERMDVRRLARDEKRSLEDAGREARHRFLELVHRREGAEAVALAHHADDQAETVLMRLLRGSGSAGLAGMSPRSGWKVRPLLEASRDQLVEYAEDCDIPWREDRSNADRRFLRNRVRHELLPLLTTYNPRITRTLAATAAILAADDEVLNHRADQRYDQLAAASGGEVFFPVKELLHEPDAIRFRLYRRAIRELRGDLRAIAYRHLLDVDGLLLHDSPSCSVTLPRSLRAARVYDSLRFSRNDLKAGGEIRINYFGGFPVPEGELVVAPVEPPLSWGEMKEAQTVIDLDAAPFPWTVRTFRDGDRFIPFGMTGMQKVKKFFIDRKIPRHSRRLVPLLFDGAGRLLWICGLRRSAVAQVSAQTTRAVLVELVLLRP